MDSNNKPSSSQSSSIPLFTKLFLPNQIEDSHDFLVNEQYSIFGFNHS